MNGFALNICCQYLSGTCTNIWSCNHMRFVKENLQNLPNTVLKKKSQGFMQPVVCKSYLNSINTSSSIGTPNAAVGCGAFYLWITETCRDRYFAHNVTEVKGWGGSVNWPQSGRSITIAHTLAVWWLNQAIGFDGKISPPTHDGFHIVTHPHHQTALPLFCNFQNTRW